MTNAPCPFCGSSNIEFIENMLNKYIRCNDCIAVGPFINQELYYEERNSDESSDAFVWRKWNHRVIDENHFPEFIKNKWREKITTSSFIEVPIPDHLPEAHRALWLEFQNNIINGSYTPPEEKPENKKEEVSEREKLFDEIFKILSECREGVNTISYRTLEKEYEDNKIDGSFSPEFLRNKRMSIYGRIEENKQIQFMIRALRNHGKKND